MTSITPAQAATHLEGLQASFDAVTDKQNICLRTIAEASQAFTMAKPSLLNRFFLLFFGRKKLSLEIGGKKVQLSVASYDNASNMGALRNLFSAALELRENSLKKVIPFVLELERRFGGLDQAKGCLGILLNKAADEKSIQESLQSADLQKAFLEADEEHKEALVAQLLKSIPESVVPSRARRLGLIYSSLKDPKSKAWFEAYAQKKVIGAQMVNASASPDQKKQLAADVGDLQAFGLDVGAMAFSPLLRQLSTQWEKKVRELTKKLDATGKDDFSAVVAACDGDLEKSIQEGIKDIPTATKELLGSTFSQMQMKILIDWKVQIVSKGIEVLKPSTLDEKKGALLWAQFSTTFFEQLFPGARPPKITAIMERLKEMQRSLSKEISLEQPKVSFLTKAQRTAEKVFRIGKRLLPSAEFLVYIGISAGAGYAEGGIFGALASGSVALFSRSVISGLARGAGNLVTDSFHLPEGAVKNTVITCIQNLALVGTWTYMMSVNTCIAGGIDAYFHMEKAATGLGLATEVPGNVFRIMWGGVKTAWYTTRFGSATVKTAADVLGGGPPTQVVQSVFMDTLSGARAGYRAGHEAMRIIALGARNLTWWTRIFG